MIQVDIKLGLIIIQNSYDNKKSYDTVISRVYTKIVLFTKIRNR